MAKKKAPKQELEELEQNEQTGVNSYEDKEIEGPVSVNLDQNGKSDSKRGVNLPDADEGRDREMDEEVIEEEDLGLAEDDFLLDRKVNQKDLKTHMHLNKKDFLGSEEKKGRDFAEIFGRGKSNKEHPKIDLAYSIDYNLPFKKELMASQLLRNFHSRDSKESKNAERVLKDLKIEEELLKEIEENAEAHQDESILLQISDILPNM